MAAAAFAWTGFTKDSVFTSAMDRSIASEFSILRAPRLFSMRAYQPSDCNIEAACMLTGALSALLGREGEASPLRLVNESTRFKPARNGALSAGDALNHPGGPLDVIDQELRARQGAGAGRGGRGERGFGWRGKLFGAAKLVVGKPLGFALRLVVPSAGAFMRLAEPVHGVITWVERYPQYRVV